jgi:PE family
MGPDAKRLGRLAIRQKRATSVECANCVRGNVKVARRARGGEAFSGGSVTTKVKDLNMSYVTAAPDVMTSAATDLADIGSTLSATHLAAAAKTVAVVPAAADEVSAGVAHLFSHYAEDYHALAGRAAVFHEQFAQRLNAGAGSYAVAEGANVASVRSLTPSAAAPAKAIQGAPGWTLQAFVRELGIFAVDLLLVPINFFIFLLKSGVPFHLFGLGLFPSWLSQFLKYL